ncbi:uncharacterized protein LOC141854249 [Brevipalpus obovatus]|uniref:uncharacterized protein LOC141854249 n=1 Tax=Brevipalpus obovatus TaxID=246614 RepID=UPI003D9E1D8B
MDFDGLNYYEFLKIEREASIDQINKAYRRRTLEYHPDKNPDDPSAKQKFEKLQEIVEILRDPVQRSDYDRKLKARDEKRVKDKELDATRRKYKENLEKRERERQEEESHKLARNINRQKEIERVRRINLQLLEDEIEKIRMKTKRDLADASRKITSGGQIFYRLTVEWDGEIDGSTVKNSRSSLTKIFSQFGKIVDLVIHGKSATIEFLEESSVHAALSDKLDNVAIRKVQVFCRDLKSPYGIRPGQTLADFENSVLGKMRKRVSQKTSR